jgi:hypothetical protein
MKLKFIILNLYLILSAGCGLVACKEHSNEEIVFVEKAPVRTSKDFLIPVEMRKEIEKKYVEFIRKENPKIILEDDVLLDRIPRDFLNIDIKLRSSASGVLSDHLMFKMPRGGGMIDLKDYVVGKKGSFYLSYNAARSNKPEERVPVNLVYFLSEARQKTIDGEKYGVGCRSYLNVTTLFQSMEHKDFQLNATGQRYIPVIGGVFYFIQFDAQRKIFLSAIRIIDSRYPEMFCSEIS